MAAARLDAAASGNTDSPSYTVSAGTDRCLVVGIQHEGAITAGSLSVTWGGQAMTSGHTIFLEAGTVDQECEMFILLDAGITSGSGTTIAITGETANTFTWHAISYTGVNQTGGATTIPTTNDASTTSSTPNPLTASDIVATAGSVVVALAGVGETTSGTWGGTNALTEQTDQADDATGAETTTGSLADRLISVGETADVECTWATQNRAVVCAMELAAVASKPMMMTMMLHSHE